MPQLLIISAREMLTSEEGLRCRVWGTHEVPRRRGMKFQPSKERTECENIRQAEGVGMEMRVRLGEK